MFNLTIAGHIGNDAVIRAVNGANGQTSVCSFSVAVKSKQKGADQRPITKWVECSLWGKRAESLAPFLTKGTAVSIDGEPSVDSFEGTSGLQLKQLLTVNDLTLLSSSSQKNAAPQSMNQNNQDQAPQGGYDPNNFG